MWRKPRISFAVKLDGESIYRVEPAHLTRVGISYSPMMPGYVAPFEEWDARIQGGYTLREWEDLHPAERAGEIAHFRLRKWIHLHRESKVYDEAEKAQRHPPRGRKR